MKLLIDLNQLISQYLCRLELINWIINWYMLECMFIRNNVEYCVNCNLVINWRNYFNIACGLKYILKSDFRRFGIVLHHNFSKFLIFISVTLSTFNPDSGSGSGLIFKFFDPEKINFEFWGSFLNFLEVRSGGWKLEQLRRSFWSFYPK